MAGHSKWANIKHKKSATDKKKGKIFSKLAKEIMVAAKEGGGDADKNPRLRTALTAAKSANLPNVNIERALKKGCGELDGVNFVELVYEGYGAEGVALMVECLTDNKNRTASDVRMTFDRNSGNLASSGAVTWMFHRKAHFVIIGEKADEEILMDIVLDAGADDIDIDENVAEIWGPVEAFTEIAKALETAGIDTENASLLQHPENSVEIDDEKAASQVLRLIDALEDLDDVQSVYSNAEINPEVLEKLEAK